MQMLCKAILKELRVETIGGLLVLIIGSVLFSYSISKQNILLHLLSWPIIYFGIKNSWGALKVQKVEESQLMKMLVQNPKQIVWVYSVVTNRMPFGFQFSKNGIMYFKMIDGKDFSVGMPEKDLKVVSRFLNRLLPHATFGYSEEKEKRYLENPELLVRSNY
jgi:uncharacterized SAM-binding protein YcdF (DUF218 family)